MEIEVFGLGGTYIGIAPSFGQAKRMQLAALPADLQDAYAGIQNGSPLFYTEMLTDELLAKYPSLSGGDD